MPTRQYRERKITKNVKKHRGDFYGNRIDKRRFFDSERERTAVSGEKCPGCGDNLEFDPETGKLKCPSCGTEKEILTRAGEEIAFSSLVGQNGNWQNETHIYHCSNCNAEEVLDRREIAHICPFCGSPSVVEREEIDTLRPNALLPFKIDKDDATKIVSVWAKKKWFAPKDFKTYFSPRNDQRRIFTCFHVRRGYIFLLFGKIGRILLRDRQTKRKERTRTAYEIFFRLRKPIGSFSTISR